MADKNEEREVVAVFDDYATAQQVARELEANGIPSNAIQIQSNFKTGAAGYGESERPAHEESGVAGFFRHCSERTVPTMNEVTTRRRCDAAGRWWR